MTAHKRHTAMKDSGVAWLGKIPAHWDVMQSRRMFDERKEKARPGDVLLTASQKYGMIPQSVFIELEGRRVVEINKGADSLIHVEAGDFVISLRSFQGGLEFSRNAGSITFHYVPIHAVKGVHEPFFAHLFKSSTYIQALRATANLIRDGQDMRFTHFAQVPLPKIPLDEQVAIADHLNRETARIDKLIARKTRFIELLSEKRQTLITHAVTKGLDSKAKMKDSSVEWLGQVPEHWSVVRLRHLLKSGMQYGATESGDADLDDGPRYIRITDLDIAGRLRKDSIKRLPADVAKPYLLNDGDILFARSGATVGKTYLHESENGAACFAGYLIRARPHASKINPRFLFFSAHSDFYWTYIRQSAIQATIENVSAEIYASFPVGVPPVDEQAQIVEVLTQKVSEIDTLTSKTERSIELLREHRTALITAAVTGKIDLREPA